MTEAVLSEDQSEIVKRSVLVAGHRTSISLELAFWEELRRLAASQGKSLNQIVTQVDACRTGNLSSALRLFVLKAIKKGGSI